MHTGPDEWRPWSLAMHDALYGENGFYRRVGAPGGHFRTAAHASALWASAVLRLLAPVAGAAIEDFTVVEVGAGGGELLAGLAAVAPATWSLIGVDIADRPPTLPPRVGWQHEIPPAFDGALIAVEWLDVVPVDVVELTPDGLRLVEVSRDGSERLGAAVDRRGASWLGRWWPPQEIADRAEIGTGRDDGWAQAVSSLRRGIAVAIDYAVDPLRDVAGTLTGYRAGRQVAPVPDGSCDITAHVLMASCADAATVDATALLSQREALLALGVSGARPSYGGDVAAYLSALQSSGEAAELLDRGGLGAFTWLVQAKGVPLPL